VDSTSQGSPNEGSKILWILDAIKDEEKSLCPFLPPLRKDLSEVSILSFFDEPNDILVKGAPHHLIKSFLCRKSERDLPFDGEIENGLDRRMRFLGANQNLLKLKME
jgi:hypothetical protein